MQYLIFGGNFPAVTFKLDQNEGIYTQSGGMSWMTPGMQMETNMRGGLLKGLGRMLSGDSLFLASLHGHVSQSGNHHRFDLPRRDTAHRCVQRGNHRPEERVFVAQPRRCS